MDLDSGFKLHGGMTAVLTKENGEVVVVQKDNIIVNVGFDMIANALGNSASRPACIGWIAVGTNTNPTAAGDTALGTELTRVAATFNHTPGTKTFTMAATFGAGVGVGALTEAGVFNSATAGAANSMLDHVAFSVINKGQNDTLTITFTFTMS